MTDELVERMAISDLFSSLRLRSPTLPGQRALGEVFERWRNALVACLPEGLRQRLAKRDQRLIIVPQSATAQLYQAQGEERELLGELNPQAAESLQALLAGTKRGQRRIVLQLPAADVLTRRVSFPLQVRDNLRQVVRYEIDRLSPFQTDQAFYDVRPQGSSTRGGKLAVELAICRRDQVQKWLNRLREAHMPADQVAWDGAWPGANLLPPEERPQGAVGAFGPTRLLLVLVLLLAAAVLVTPLWQKQQVLTRLEAELEDLSVEAQEVEKVRGALERAREGSVAVLQRKWEEARVIDLLRELTQRLPDDTWVQNLDIREGEIQIRGESAQATALIGLLEQAPGIDEVTFRSPVVQVATTGRERFHISFRYQGQRGS